MLVLSDLILTCAELRLGIRSTRDDAMRARLFRAEQRLRAQLPPSVTKTVAAGALGISVQGLDRWLDRGAVPVVQAPRTQRHQVETTPLIELVGAVTRLREEGRSGRLVSAALAALGWQLPGQRVVLRSEVAALPRPNPSVLELQHDYRSTTPAERLRDQDAISEHLGLLAAGARRSVAGARRSV